MYGYLLVVLDDVGVGVNWKRFAHKRRHIVIEFSQRFLSAWSIVERLTMRFSKFILVRAVVFFVIARTVAVIEVAV